MKKVKVCCKMIKKQQTGIKRRIIRKILMSKYIWRKYMKSGEGMKKHKNDTKRAGKLSKKRKYRSVKGDLLIFWQVWILRCRNFYCKPLIYSTFYLFIKVMLFHYFLFKVIYDDLIYCRIDNPIRSDTGTPMFKQLWKIIHLLTAGWYNFNNSVRHPMTALSSNLVRTQITEMWGSI